MFFLGWIFFSIVAGMFAQIRRNRNGAGWFFVAILFSPLVAFVLLLILPSLPARLTRKEIIEQLQQLQTLRQCPHCAEMVKREAKVCKHCHRDLPEAEPLAPAEPTPKLNGIKLCPIATEPCTLSDAEYWKANPTT